MRLEQASHLKLMIKNPPASVGDTRYADSVAGLGRSPGGGNGNPLQYSFLENPMDRGAWQAVVHGVTKNWTRLSTAQHSTKEAITLKTTFYNLFSMLMRPGERNGSGNDVCPFWILLLK